MLITANLKSADFIIHYGVLIATGNICKEVFKRFPENARVATSPVTAITIHPEHGLVIQTKNSVYKIENLIQGYSTDSLKARFEVLVRVIREHNQAMIKERLILSSAGNTLRDLKKKRSMADRKSNFLRVKRIVSDIKVVRNYYYDAQKQMSHLVYDKNELKRDVELLQRVIALSEKFHAKAD